MFEVPEKIYSYIGWRSNNISRSYPGLIKGEKFQLTDIISFSVLWYRQIRICFEAIWLIIFLSFFSVLPFSFLCFFHSPVIIPYVFYLHHPFCSYQTGPSSNGCTDLLPLWTAYCRLLPGPSTLAAKHGLWGTPTGPGGPGGPWAMW